MIPIIAWLARIPRWLWVALATVAALLVLYALIHAWRDASVDRDRLESAVETQRRKQAADDAADAYRRADEALIRNNTREIEEAIANESTAPNRRRAYYDSVRRQQAR